MTVVFRRLAASSFLWLPSSTGSRCCGGAAAANQFNLAFQATPSIAATCSTKSSTRRMASAADSSGDPAPVFSMDDLLSFAGTYQGKGSVLKSNGEQAATYTETAEFRTVRKTDAFVVYRHVQETQHATKHNPMHTETGFLKLLTDGTAVASFAHPFPSGFIDELSTGRLEQQDGTTIKTLTLTAKDFQRAEPNPQAGKKQVKGFQRVYTLEGDGTLSYKQYLSTSDNGDNLYHHLTCTFTKTNKEE